MNMRENSPIHLTNINGLTIIEREGEPDSLVVIEEDEQKLRRLYLQFFQSNHIIAWAGDIKKVEKQLAMLKHACNKEILKFQSFEDLKQGIKDKNEVYLICSPHFYNQRDQILSEQSVTNLIYYPADSLLNSLQIHGKSQNHQEQQFIQGETKNCYYVWENNLQSMTKIISNNNCKNKVLPNFVHITDEAHNSHSNLRSMFAMINQKLTQQTIIHLFSKLKNLVMKLKSEIIVQYQSCVDEFKMINHNNIEEKYRWAIKWYTSNNWMDLIANNLLRSSKSATQQYYIQPFFKLLFNAVQNIHSRNKAKRSFLCYRGGRINEQQVKFFRQNIGQIVQNLGFLSTSISKNVARRFINNALFTIQICQQGLSSQHNYGYADISKQSAFTKESEVLINPLNSFFVEEFIVKQRKKDQQIKPKYEIRLRFGVLSYIRAKKNCYLDQKQRKYKNFCRYQKFLKQTTLLQGDCFLFRPFNYFQAELYWDVYKKSVEKCLAKGKLLKNEAQGKLQRCLFNQAWTCYYKSDYNSSLKIIPELLKLIKEKQKKADIRYIRVLYLQAKIMSKLNQKKQVLRIYIQLMGLVLQSDPFIIQIHFLVAQGHLSRYQIKQAKAHISKVKNKLGRSYNCSNYEAQKFIQLESIIFIKQGSYKKAKDNFEELLRQHKAIFGEDQRYGEILIQLGMLYFQISKLDQSFQYFQKAYLIFVHLSCEVEKVFVLMQFFGVIHLLKNQLDQAKKIFQQCSQYVQHSFGKNSYQFVSILHLKGRVSYRKKMFKQAFHYYKSSLQILRLFGKRTPLYANILGSFAQLCLRQLKFKQCQILYYRVLKIISQTLGKKNLKYIHTLSKLGSLFLEKGPFSRCVHVFETLLKVTHQMKQIPSQSLFDIYNNLGVAYLFSNEVQKSIQVLQKGKKLWESQHQPIYHRSIAIFHSLGQAYLKAGQYRQGFLHLAKFNQLALQYHGEKSQEYIKSLSELGKSMIQKGYIDSALIYLERANRILQTMSKRIRFYYRLNHLLVFYALINEGSRKSLIKAKGQMFQLFKKQKQMTRKVEPGLILKFAQLMCFLEEYKVSWKLTEKMKFLFHRNIRKNSKRKPFLQKIRFDKKRILRHSKVKQDKLTYCDFI